MNTALLEKMQSFSDTRIMNTIQQANSYDPEMVEAAKHVARQKGLTSEENMRTFENKTHYKNFVIQQINEGVEPNQIKSNLMAQGVQEDLAKEILSEAARNITIRKKEKKSEGSNTSVWTILFIVFFVIRILLRMAQSH